VNADGLALDKQRHTQPVWGLDADAPRSGADVVGLLAAAAGVSAADVLGYDILTADTQPPARFGQGRQLFASRRLDNLSSVHAGVVALLAAAGSGATGQIAMLAAFDHEELGSESRSGASGPFLEDVLTRVSEGLGGSASDRRRAFAASWVVSADAGHSVHPNYSDRHDPVNRPVAGGGPLLKINANQRYTTDAAGAALWARLCETAGVPYQEFVSNNAMPCGSTIGPLTATRLGIATVDVGIPLLSMHSARELCHVNDPVSLAGAITAFFAA
jgi:aspartyl aminopeptidase